MPRDVRTPVRNNTPKRRPRPRPKVDRGSMEYQRAHRPAPSRSDVRARKRIVKARPKPIRGTGLQTGTGKTVKLKTAGGKTVKVSYGRAKKILAKSRRTVAAKEKEARYQGYPDAKSYALANRATSKPKDFKVAGLNIDRITGKGGRAAIDVLEETTRPIHGIAGGAKAAIEGKNVPKAVSRGLSNEDKYTFSDVIKSAGYKGPGAGTAGFVLDVGLDPTTYLTFGSAVPATVAAKAAGKKAVAEATAKGLSKKAVKQAKSRASKKAFQEGSKRKRITVGVGGKRANTGIPSPTIPAKVRDKVSGTLPVRPSNISEKEWTKLQSAGRTRRGTILSETRRTTRRAVAVKKALGGAQRRILPERSVAGGKVRVRPRPRTAPLTASQKVRDALESGELKGLEPNELMAAKEVVREQRRGLKMRREAGEKPKVYQQREPTEPRGYVARVLTQQIDDPAIRRKIGRTEGWAERKPRGPGGNARGARATSTPVDLMRTDRRPMAEVRQEGRGGIVEDIPTTMVAKGQKDIRSAANTAYRGEVKAMGRQVKKGKAKARADEAVYTVEKGTLKELDPKDVPKAANTKPGELVILKRSVADHANAQVAARKRIPFLDPATNKIKWALTIPNPQYWSRNYYGGLYNVWSEGATAKGTARAVPTAHRVARRMGKVAKAQETLGKKPKDPGTINLGKSGKVSVDDLIAEVEKHNVSGGGITSELMGAETKRRSKMQVFEDVPRLAAYIHFRRKGLDPDKATARAMNSQFDYGALTTREMNTARRIFPFYTWRSRNVVLQADTLAKRPGKLATVQKAREELGKGLPADWEDKLSEGEALGVPIPVPGTKQLLYPGLPVTDLNLFTTSPAAWLKQVGSMTNPVAKAPVEFMMNYNLFFRDQIEQDYGKWFSAPDAVINRMPAPLRAQLEKDGIIKMGKDRWTGERTWQWRGKADYVGKLTPITSTLLQTATSGRSRKGQKSEQRVAAWLTGLRTQPFEPKANELYEVYEKLGKVTSKKRDLEELRSHKRKGWSAEKHSGEPGWDTPEYARLKKREMALKVRKYQLEGHLKKKDRGAKPTGGGSSGGGSGMIAPGGPKIRVKKPAASGGGSGMVAP